MYLVLALLCLVSVTGSFSDDNIHDFVSREEIQRAFQMHQDSDYEIVKIKVSERLQKRDLPSGSHLRMRAFGEDISLWLNPSDSNLAGVDTPVYYARSSPYHPEGVEFIRRNGLMGMVDRIFEDPNMLASFVISTDGNGRTRLNGNIASRNIVVRSLPPSIAEEYRRRRRSSGYLEDSDSPFHVVFKSSEVAEIRFPLLTKNETERRFARSAVPSVLYPEVLVVVENSIYKAEMPDIYGFLEYLLAFWNAVDLRYRSLENPGVRFHIAGIVLSMDPEATPYISKNSLKPDTFNSTQAMLDIRTFYYGIKDSISLDSYDIAIVMTRLRFGIGKNSGIQGLARVGLACDRNDYARTMDGVALIYDRGTFDGIHTAAHEIGHLLGAHHDPDTPDCYFENGFIMALTMVSTANSSDFSSCAMKAFQHRLGLGELICLYNFPQQPRKELPKLMPGMMHNLERQCKDVYMATTCQPPKSENTSICVKMYCVDGEECQQTVYPALEGSPCEGHNKFCLHHQCVSL